jgi:sulfur carrier protein
LTFIGGAAGEGFFYTEKEKGFMIKLNGVERPERDTLGVFMADNGYAEIKIAVLVNGEIVRREEWSAYRLSTGDEVDVVSFVGGG